VADEKVRQDGRDEGSTDGSERLRTSVAVQSIGKVAVPAGVVLIVLMLVIPLPAFILDLLLVGQHLRVAADPAGQHVRQAAARLRDLPALLLIATMFRLALNVSTTRLVLLDGYAGKVVEAFGSFVMGGSLVVGMVIFLILVVIQFMVITNGATRVAEVGARFTLDAMPGKQMAIDADLNSGLIDEDTARQRRADVSAEATSTARWTAPRSSSRATPSAGIIITIINLIGGFAIGVVQRGMPAGEAATTYSLLTVGDGLVSQVPALLVSVASGLIVTRSATNGDMGSDLIGQVSAQRTAVRLGGSRSSAWA
jgi:flagellar biosynthesis protein FlhA